MWWWCSSTKCGVRARSARLLNHFTCSHTSLIYQTTLEFAYERIFTHTHTHTQVRKVRTQGRTSRFGNLNSERNSINKTRNESVSDTTFVRIFRHRRKRMDCVLWKSQTRKEDDSQAAAHSKRRSIKSFLIRFDSFTSGPAHIQRNPFMDGVLFHPPKILWHSVWSQLPRRIHPI